MGGVTVSVTATIYEPHSLIWLTFEHLLLENHCTWCWECSTEGDRDKRQSWVVVEGVYSVNSLPEFKIHPYHLTLGKLVKISALAFSSVKWHNSGVLLTIMRIPWDNVLVTTIMPVLRKLLIIVSLQKIKWGPLL